VLRAPVPLAEPFRFVFCCFLRGSKAGAFFTCVLGTSAVISGATVGGSAGVPLVVPTGCSLCKRERDKGRFVYADRMKQDKGPLRCSICAGRQLLEIIQRSCVGQVLHEFRCADCGHCAHAPSRMSSRESSIGSNHMYRAVCASRLPVCDVHFHSVR
jgi:hypothetical protein